MAKSVRLDWNGDKVKLRQRKGATSGLATAGEHLLGASRLEVPIEEGTLERSGRAHVDETHLEMAVSYDTVYAVRQHEELTWRHDAGRKAKYLEDPLNRETATMLALVAAAIRRSLK